MISTNILLGAVAGVTIFFGLLIARWRKASERTRGLLGNDPDAISLQKLLRAHNVFDSLNNALTAYVRISGDGSVSKDEIERTYQAVLTTTEQARRAIAGAAYDTPSFRSRAAKFVMDTAASEYATAT